jgi:hypothetical protein
LSIEVRTVGVGGERLLEQREDAGAVSCISAEPSKVRPVQNSKAAVRQE